MLEIFLPFLLAGFGMVLAGLLLDSVQHWSVFQACPEIFILGPSMLNHPNFKVQLFCKGHKNLKTSPSCFTKSADLLSKYQNKRGIFFKLCGLLTMSQLYNYPDFIKILSR